jgi:hypothetical protein
MHECHAPVVLCNAGNSSSMAFLSQVGQSPIPGRVFTWGKNVNFRPSLVPTEAASQGIVDVITSGRDHIVALTNDGRALPWGVNENGQLDIPPELQGSISAVAAGTMHTLLLLNNGSVVCVGGRNDSSVCDVPHVLMTDPTASSTRGPVQRISVSKDVSFAQLANGTWVAWGENMGYTRVRLSRPAWNAVGDGPFHVQLPPPAFAYPNSSSSATSATANISAIAPNLDGASTSFLMLDATTGSIYSRYSPLLVPLHVQDANISRACKSSLFGAPPAWQLAAAVSDEGRVWAWTLDGASMPVPAEVQGRTISVACGHGLVVAVLEGGGVAAWGPMVDAGVLPPLPTQAELSSGGGVVAAAAGYTFVLLLLGNGTAVPVGALVGPATTMVPDELGLAGSAAILPSPIATLTAGTTSAVAQRQDGSLVVWGDPWGVAVPPAVRAAAAGGQGALKLAAGNSHMVALLPDGSVAQW